MLRLRKILPLSLALLFASTSAYADTLLVANLTNSQENPPTNPTTSTGGARPASFGTATFVLNTAQTSLTFSATIFNIDFTGSQTADVNDNLIAAHIHASATVTPTTNAGVVWGFFGSPFNDNNPNDVVITPFANGVGGVISGKWDLPEGNNTTLAAQLPNILSGHSYINFHTTQFGGGEIRGRLLADTTPPVIVCPGSITRFTDSGQFNATVNPGVPVATDNVGVLSVTGVRSDGKALNAPYPIGVTLIIWTATDFGGNTATCGQSIAVTLPSGERRRP